FVLIADKFNNGLIMTNPPFLAVAPDDPRTLYLAWNDGRWDSSFDYFGNPGQHADIAFSRSTDAGATWSAPQRVNDDPQGNGVAQCQPSIAVAPDGRVGVIWHDRRDDPNGYLYNLYYSESTDQGRTWSANQRGSDVPSNPMGWTYAKGNGYMG